MSKKKLNKNKKYKHKYKKINKIGKKRRKKYLNNNLSYQNKVSFMKQKPLMKIKKLNKM